ncbi:hypothetical protein [Chlorobium sp.]|uniref:hypothetical protein n=1 Tax=Chlorobium sp. TaxID=1095 RepID=UPI003C6F8876
MRIAVFANQIMNNAMEKIISAERERLHRMARKTLPGFGFLNSGSQNTVAHMDIQAASDCDGGCGGQCLSGCKDECITVSK